MNLETFAAMQRQRIRSASLEGSRRRQLQVRSFDVTETQERPSTLTWFRPELIASHDPIRSAYRKMGLMYE